MHLMIKCQKMIKYEKVVKKMKKPFRYVRETQVKATKWRPVSPVCGISNMELCLQTDVCQKVAQVKIPSLHKVEYKLNGVH